MSLGRDPYVERISSGHPLIIGCPSFVILGVLYVRHNQGSRLTSQTKWADDEIDPRRIIRCQSGLSAGELLAERDRKHEGCGKGRSTYD